MEVEKSRRSAAWVWVAGIGALFALCLCAVLVVAGSLLIYQSGVQTSAGETSESEVAARTETEPAPATEAPPTALPPANTEVPESPATAEPATDTPEPTEAPPATGTASPSPESEGGAQTGKVEDPEDAALRAEIEANVSDIRGLDPLEPVTTVLLTREELRERVENDLFAEFTEEDAREFTIILHAFDFVPLDFDYYNFTLDLYTEQIAGYYDTETNEFYVISDDDELDAGEQITHAHEFVHALQDQHFSLDDMDEENLDSEASAALSALAEGEATLVQTLYLLGGYLDFEELADLFAEQLDAEFPVLDNAPPVLANNLLFPYTSGVEFVQTIYDQGGFDAIDAAWANPPTSTEHILHPDRYLSGDLPQVVATAPLTDTLGAGWRMLDEEIFGEFFLREYLTQELSGSQVDEAATGWGGDRYAVYWNEADGAVVGTLYSTWDTPQDGDEFAVALSNYATARYGSAGVTTPDGGVCWQGEDVTCLYRFGSDTFLIRAPELAIASAIAAAQ